MSKKGWMFAIVLVLVVASVVAARQPSPPYAMEIRHIDNGISLQCKSGCDWISLKGMCEDPNLGCTYVVSERGIRVFPAGMTPQAGAAEPGR